MKPFKNRTSYPEAFRKVTTLTLATAFAGQFLLVPCQASQTPPKKFQLRAGQDFIRPEDGPTLNRNDIKNAGDPFDSSGAGNGTEDFEPPASAFKVQAAKTGMPPATSFPLSANDSGDFNGQGMPGMGDQMPQQQAPRQQMMPPDMQPPTQMNQNRVNPNDPDSSREMQLAWDEWHRRVAEAIFNQIQSLAGTFLKRTAPLVCVINYQVTRDGRVTNVHMQQNSSNLFYNAMVYKTVCGMSGNPVLAYPQGSRRMIVDKLSTFGHNTGNQGFRSITNDKETLKGR